MIYDIKNRGLPKRIALQYVFSYFRVHIWRAHLKLRPYKCKYCEYTSVLRAPIYRQHVASVHGKKDGSLDDVELLLDVAKKIDEFEKDNR